MATVGEMVILSLLWRKAGRHTPPPPEIAELSEADQEDLYRRADAFARTRGEDYADAVIANLMAIRTLADRRREGAL